MSLSVSTENFPAGNRLFLSPCFAISLLAHIVFFGTFLFVSSRQAERLPSNRPLMLDLQSLALPEVPRPARKPQPPQSSRPVPAAPAPLEPARVKEASLPAASSATSPVPVPAPVPLPSRGGAARHGTPAVADPGHGVPSSSGAVANEPPRKVVQHAELSARSGYLALLRKLIEKCKEYPLLARRRHLEGTAVVRFEVTRSGSLKGVALAGSSGSSILDESALHAVQSVGGLPPLPAELAERELKVEVPLTFRLADR